MSITEQRFSFEIARRELQLLRDAFRVEDLTERWLVAGSYRRIRSARDAGLEPSGTLGDIEHLIIPKFGHAPQHGELFDANQNLLWVRLDEALREGTIEPARYGENCTLRWGDKFRGFTYRGIRHEFYTATITSWGKMLALRTGPPAFSKKIVSRLNDLNYRHKDGELYTSDGDLVNLADENLLFARCGWSYVAPHRRT